MDERDDLAVQDEEFEKLLHDGLVSSFEDEELCVTEDLIARTLKAIKTECEGESNELPELSKIVKIQDAGKENNVVTDARVRRNRFIRIAAGIAAAMFVGVIGISLFGGRMKKDSGTSSENSMKSAMYSMTNMKEATASKRDDSATMVSDAAQVDNYISDETFACDSECADVPVMAEGESNNCVATDYYNLSGDESVDVYEEVRSIAQNAWVDVIYDTTGFVTDDMQKQIPDDMGELLLVITYMSDDVRYMGSIGIYKGYCEISESNPLSSDSSDYCSRLAVIEDGEALTADLVEILKQAEQSVE